MKQTHRVVIAISMVILLVAATVSGAAAGLEECLPKACCCSKATLLNAEHGQQPNTTSGCTGNGPCCQMEQDNKPEQDVVLSSTAELPQQKSQHLAIVGGPHTVQPQSNAQSATNHHMGKPKAPLVPLYLQTQTFLC